MKSLNGGHQSVPPDVMIAIDSPFPGVNETVSGFNCGGV
jgi:hypothetical protein